MPIHEKSEHPWVFLPLKRSNDHLFLHFYPAGGTLLDTPVMLDTLRKLGATILSSPFSPYDLRFEFSLGGDVFLLIEDELDGYCLVARMDKEKAIQDFVEAMQRLTN